jgi:hypothetical protein
MRTIRMDTALPTSADRVWSAMLSPATFLYVCQGLSSMPAPAGRVEPLRAGERGTGWLLAFHVIPAYRHTIEVVDVEERAGTIRTHEHGGMITVWNHTLQVEPINAHTCRYSDTVDIDAGPATAFVATMAAGIYRSRQRRWRKLVHKHLLPAGPSYAT